MTEPLDLLTVEARLENARQAVQRGSLMTHGDVPLVADLLRGSEALLAALRETRSALRPLAEHPGDVLQSEVHRAQAVLAKVRDE